MRALLVVLALVATARAMEPPPACGNGPVEIRVSIGSCCACRDSCLPGTPVRHPDGSYSVEGGGRCTLACCDCGTVTERWTDYPECGGRKLSRDLALGDMERKP